MSLRFGMLKTLSTPRKSLAALCGPVLALGMWSASPLAHAGNQLPIGDVNAVKASWGIVQIDGWAIDPDTSDSIPVHVYLGGPAGSGELHDLGYANVARPDVAAAYPGYGLGHGTAYNLLSTAQTGKVPYYVYAIDGQDASKHTLIGNGTVNIPMTNKLPVGSFDGAAGGNGMVTVSGWALDPDLRGGAIIPVHVYVGGPYDSGEGHDVGEADASRPDVTAAIPHYDSNHGYNATFLTARRGTVPVYVYAIDFQDAHSHTLLGIHNVTIE
ncbi:MAG: hypothetical protein LBE78_00470 [Burkholderiaceae bacterium]|nr:hypothetical protein [Burkholderiaceae bacterium]